MTNDKQALIDMLERARAPYATSDNIGNSIIIEGVLVFNFDSKDMIDFVETTEGWL